MKAIPTFQVEAALWARGYRAIAGMDEVGRGPLAGPVVAAAVVAPPQAHAPWLQELRESKSLSAKARQRFYELILGWAQAAGVGMAEVEVVDSQGIIAATRLAMVRALAQLPYPPDYLLVDALSLPQVPLPQSALIKGDALCLSIAAASILAKVTRDRLMSQVEVEYPGYGFARHKGYGTPEHLAQLRSLGPCPIHRRSFAPVRALLEAR